MKGKAQNVRSANLDYIGLVPYGDGAAEGIYRGIERARAGYSREQVVCRPSVTTRRTGQSRPATQPKFI